MEKQHTGTISVDSLVEQHKKEEKDKTKDRDRASDVAEDRMCIFFMIVYSVLLSTVILTIICTRLFYPEISEAGKISKGMLIVWLPIMTLIFSGIAYYLINRAKAKK